MKRVIGSSQTITNTRDSANFITFRLAFINDTLKCFYGENGVYQKTPAVMLAEKNNSINVGRIFFLYKKGARKKNRTHVMIDDISLFENNTIINKTDAAHTFKETLYKSNGDDTIDIFKTQDLRQCAFQLFNSIGGTVALPDWQNYTNVVQELASSTANGNGVPLMIATAEFYPLMQENSNNITQKQRFFMTACSREDIPSKNINFVFPLGSEYSTHEDLVTKVSLDVDNDRIVIDPSTSMAPYTFKSPGIKFITATVEFQSGFIGKNVFTVEINDEN
jgi:hypothetical protein